MIKKYRVNRDVGVELPDNVSCIGFFDGVHLGHQALIKKTVEVANKEKVEPFLITFYPDPNDVIFKSKSKHINTFNERIRLFEKFGIKGVIIIDFDKDVMSISKEDFVNKYLSKFNLHGLVCGYDFHYGYKGGGNYLSLKRDMKGICKTYVVDEIKYYGKKVSSTRIRNEIDNKNTEFVNKLLGYKYF